MWRPNGPGTGLFSRGLMTPVSWALERFTAVFGMGTGGTTPLSPPGPLGRPMSWRCDRPCVWWSRVLSKANGQRTWILPTC